MTKGTGILHPKNCPGCGETCSENTSYSPLAFNEDDTEIHRDAVCELCDCEWTEFYETSGFTITNN